MLDAFVWTVNPWPEASFANKNCPLLRCHNQSGQSWDMRLPMLVHGRQNNVFTSFAASEVLRRRVTHIDCFDPWRWPFDIVLRFGLAWAHDFIEQVDARPQDDFFSMICLFHQIYFQGEGAGGPTAEIYIGSNIFPMGKEMPFIVRSKVSVCAPAWLQTIVAFIAQEVQNWMTKVPCGPAVMSWWLDQLQGFAPFKFWPINFGR